MLRKRNGNYILRLNSSLDSPFPSNINKSSKFCGVNARLAGELNLYLGEGLDLFVFGLGLAFFFGAGLAEEVAFFAGALGDGFLGVAFAFVFFFNDFLTTFGFSSGFGARPTLLSAILPVFIYRDLYLVAIII
jgi:hypothetical protein